MKVGDLLSQLATRGGDVRAVYTGVGDPEDRYAIIQDRGKWEVFYSEQGDRLELRIFASEDDACEYLLNLLEKDETVWRKS